jgi:hypothetical protein
MSPLAGDMGVCRKHYLVCAGELSKVTLGTCSKNASRPRNSGDVSFARDNGRVSAPPKASEFIPWREHSDRR